MRDVQLATAGRSWLPIDLPYLRAVTLKTLVYADDVKFRWMMALSSLGWVTWIYLDPDMFNRPYYKVMGQLMLPNFWAVLFFFHGAGAIWRIYDRTERIAWGLAVNGLGVAVWVAATVCQNLSSPHHFTASNVLEVFACLFLLGTFTSTGFSNKSVTA